MVANILKEHNLMDKGLRMTRTDYSNFNKTINNLLSREELQQLLALPPKYQMSTHQQEQSERKGSARRVVKMAQQKRQTKTSNAIQINHEKIYQTIT